MGGYLKAFLSVPEWGRVLEIQNWSANLLSSSRKRGYSRCFGIVENWYLEVLWRRRAVMIDAF